MIDDIQFLAVVDAVDVEARAGNHPDLTLRIPNLCLARIAVSAGVDIPLEDSVLLRVVVVYDLDRNNAVVADLLRLLLVRLIHSRVPSRLVCVVFRIVAPLFG